MAGTIKHEWNGTVLTITSDSGTSSADLKGDTGQRGAQGAAGIGINGRDGKDGTVSFDNLTAAQIEMLKGDSYVITTADYQHIANIVLSNFVDGEGVKF